MSSLKDIKGIDPKIEKYFENLGISSKQDLLNYFPRDYETYEEVTKISNVEIGSIVTVEAIVVTKPSFFKRGNLSITSTWLDDGSSRIRAYWFNSPFINKSLTVGLRAFFRGKVSKSKNGITLTQCKIFKEEAYLSLKGALNPVYSLTKGLTNYGIKRAIKEVLEHENNGTLFTEYLTDNIINERQLCDEEFAYKNIHFPKNYDDMIKARNRLVYDEFFTFSLALFLNKEKKVLEGRNEFKNIDENKIYDIVKKLPYKLTTDQEKVLRDIINDFKISKKMNRLIEGDVGSGKTILAILSGVIVASKKIQTAFMAPTELLAEQHYQNICRLVIDNVLPDNLNVALLTGSTKVKERRLILEGLKNGDIDIVVGTHALFSNDVIYKDLGLCIIDEQHRFGVEQRKALEEKANNANIIVMSATPIPRTLAMLLYADMDISYIKEKPKDRLAIKNCVITKKDREKGYKAIQKELSLGHQAYVICASIEKNDDEDVGSFANYQNVNDYAEILKEYFDKDVKIEILHGKMKSEKKESIMRDFKDGKIDILVSTTVVEVGVDVPNATFIMVEDAGSFGLAELHQLRGRVGRGKDQSYALFVDTKPTEKSKERLNVLYNSNDGFFIAEEDLRLRGAGDIFGVRQSGEMNFRIADMYTDIAIFRNAQLDAKEFIDKGYEISDNLKRRIDLNLERGYII